MPDSDNARNAPAAGDSRAARNPHGDSHTDGHARGASAARNLYGARHADGKAPGDRDSRNTHDDAAARDRGAGPHDAAAGRDRTARDRDDDAEPDAREPVPVLREVDFGTARLLPDIDRDRAWLLTVDGAPQSYVDLDDPGHLEFEYVRRIAYAVEAAFPGGEPLDAVHLGGGAMTLPRWLAHVRPGSRQQVVEADRRLAALVAEALPLPEAQEAPAAPEAPEAPAAPNARQAQKTALTVHTQDARAWLRHAPPGSADLLVADVFGGSRVPAALTSVEFVRAAARVLRPEGLYVANLADSAPFAFLRSQLATVRAAFATEGGADLCVLAEPAVLRGRRYGNAVLVASRRPLPLAALTRLCAADAFPARAVHGPDLDRLTGAARPVTDASATASPEPPAGAFSVG